MIKITNNGVLTTDPVTLQLIIRAALREINSMSLCKGSAEYRDRYGMLFNDLTKAFPWPTEGKIEIVTIPARPVPVVEVEDLLSDDMEDLLA